MAKGLDDLAPGDPVRVAGRHGLWRFLQWEEHHGKRYASLVGPVGKAEIQRLIPVEKLKPAGRRVTRGQVAMHPGLRDLSARAHSRRR